MTVTVPSAASLSQAFGAKLGVAPKARPLSGKVKPSTNVLAALPCKNPRRLEFATAIGLEVSMIRPPC